MKIETPKTQFEDKHHKNGLMVLFVKELMLSNRVKISYEILHQKNHF
jgi:hypothetical protein